MVGDYGRGGAGQGQVEVLSCERSEKVVRDKKGPAKLYGNQEYEALKI